MTTIAEACQKLLTEVSGTGMEINFSGEGVITVHWNGVNRFDGTPADAVKVINLVKQLEKLGMKDC